MQMQDLDPSIRPWLIEKTPDGTRVTLSGGTQECLLPNTPSEVYSYFGIPEPKFRVFAFLAKVTGVAALQHYLAVKRGLNKYSDPDFRRLVRAKNPPRPPGFPKRDRGAF